MNIPEIDIMSPTAETVQVGDVLLGHGLRIIPFRGPATIEAKSHISKQMIHLTLRFEDGKRTSIMVGTTYPVLLQPPF